ncbi:MAG TPA: hypothetical protein VE338_18410 [Ktedonobacterales bacterium]|jgi:hypothetical protein|nr:hypothetical protein [Ktedonobacterales bacterium]
MSVDGDEDDEDVEDVEDVEEEDDEQQDDVVYDDDLAYVDPEKTLLKPWMKEANWPAHAEETIRFVRHALKYNDDGLIALHWLHVGYLALASHSDALAREWRVNHDELRSFLRTHERAARQEIAVYSEDAEGRGHSRVAYHFWADGDREWGDAFVRGDYESMFYTRAQIAERIGYSHGGEPEGSDAEAHGLTKHVWDQMLSAVATRAANLRHLAGK